MNYEDFFKKFAGSARTKNVERVVERVNDASGRRVKRRFALPAAAGLPPEFIRLCPWEVEYLFTVARRAHKGILEIGRFNGGSTFLLACANSTAAIHSIDLDPRDDDRLRNLFERHGVGQNVDLIVGDSRVPRPDAGPFDLIFIDGDHSYDGCLADAVTWYPYLIENGHLVFHDSYLGIHGVQDAVVDFAASHPELEILVSPFIGPSYWHYQAGSMTHLWKRSGRLKALGLTRD